ncbi:MAG: autotransporter-associated beta strand repeat-containing protein [Rhizomicrobium sp.]
MKHRDSAKSAIEPLGQSQTCLSVRNAAVVVSVGLLTTLALHDPAVASPTINTGSTTNASSLGTSDAPVLNGGTLKLDAATTLANNFTLNDVSTNTIDADGHAATMSGAFTGTGPIIFTDSVGGGNVTLSSSANTYSGITTINSGATLTLSGTGTIVDSPTLVDNGTFNIAPTTNGATVVSLSGSGAVNLGAETLTLSEASATFSGTIAGTGGLVISGGEEVFTGTNTYTGGTTINGALQIGSGGAAGSIVGNVADAGTLSFDRTDAIIFDGTISGTGNVSQLGSGSLTLTAANTYTGTTTINAGTLALSGNGSIAGSSVSDTGTFDISATSGSSIASLSGTGTVQLGSQTLTLTKAAGTFSGVIAGSGNFVLNGGTELLSGTNTYTGSTTVNAGTLELGSAAITNNIVDSGTVAFDTTTTLAMSGVVSGSGGVSQIDGITTVSTAQTYTGVTTISGGTFALSGSGSIANSSGVVATGTFSIASAATGVSITSLSGTGAVQLGAMNLTLTNASGAFSGVISGTGTLTLASGNETLSGSNTFTGITTIAGGTLVLSNPTSLATSSITDNGTLDISSITSFGTATSTSIISLRGSGAVVLGTKTLILTDAADTFAGIISGTGGINLSGGTLTLTGANTYTGTTTISGGNLMLAGAGSLLNSDTVADTGVFDISGVTSGPTVTLGSLSGSGTVVLGAENLNLSNASTTFAGAISGAGQLIVGGGTQVLSGTNSYTGGTTISAGTLQIGSGLSSGSIVGNVVNNGVLVFDREDSSAFLGTISGTGSVVQMGSGTTILTAANTYSGGTTINAGTLQIGNGSASGSITGSVTDNGTLAFGRSDTTTFGGAISGTGGVTQISGTTILTAIDSYSGATTINSLAGLTLAGPASIASSSGVTDNGAFDVSATTTAPQIASLSGSGTVTLGGQTLTLTNGTGVFSGTISGTGGLVFSGGKSETLSGANTYTGSTTVNSGTLVINGSIASSIGVTVNSGGTLAGAGTVPAVVLASGGTIAPGSSGTGTLNVNGAVAFSSGSDFVVDLNSTSAGKLSASGAESLAGTLSIVSTDGTYLLGQKITVLTAAGGVTGDFNLTQITGTGAEFSSALSYDAHDVFLEINLAKLSPLLPTGSTANESKAVGGIDAAIAAGNTLPSQFENLGTVSPAALQTDAGQFAGEVAADVAQAGDSLFDPFLNAIFHHVADEQPTGSSHSQMPQRNEVWASGIMGTNLTTGDDTLGTHRVKSNMTGAVAGGDWNIEPDILIGAAASAGSSNFTLSDSFGKGKVNAFQLGVYGFYQFSRHFYGSFAVAGGLDDVTTTRVLTVSGTDTLTGKFNSRIFGGRYETGAEVGWLTPYVALQDDLFDAPSYKETASSGSDTYGLSYAGHMTNAADTELGFRQRGDIDLNDWMLKFSDRFAWQHDLSATPSTKAAFTALPASSFTAYGARSGKNALLVSLGTGLESKDGFGIDLHFDSAITSTSQTYTEAAELKFAW